MSTAVILLASILTRRCYGTNNANIVQIKTSIKPFIVFVEVWLSDKTYKSYHSVSTTYLYSSVQF